MQEIRQVAATATRDKEAFYDKKRSAQALRFDDLSDDDNDGNGPNLSDVPHHNDFRYGAGQKRRAGRLGSPRTRRRAFTEEEKAAIQEGVEKHGFGNWSSIKAEYAMILKDRTMQSQKRRAAV